VPIIQLVDSVYTIVSPQLDLNVLVLEIFVHFLEDARAALLVHLEAIFAHN